jgi:hypothetical protein
MSDLFLAVLVVSAVIAFGALISVGNERQRRAIDALHRAYKQWAVQDLRLKRGTVSAQIRIDDLTSWLTKVTSLAFGSKTIVMDFQLHTSPVTTIAFHDAGMGNTIVCTLEPPATVLLELKKKRSVLTGEIRSNPLFRISRKTPAVELSILNAGAMFDLELPKAWKSLTDQSTQADTLWAYILD